MECCFCPFATCQVMAVIWQSHRCHIYWSQICDRSVRGRQIQACVTLLFSLVMVATLQNLLQLWATYPPLSLIPATICNSHPGHNAVSEPLVLSVFPSECCNPTLHCYCDKEGTGSIRLYLWNSSLSFLILPPLLTLICPPSDVLMHGCLRHVCVIREKFFVEVQLSNL